MAVWLWLGCQLPAHAATLVYEGFVAGVRAGSATVELTIDGDRYRISGTAAADGVADWFSNWRSDFAAAGQLAGGVPLPSLYEYTQQDGESWRQVRVRDGQVSYRKNQRPPRNSPAFPTPDLLAALFVSPLCRDVLRVNTGRRDYRLERRAGKPGVCRYEVFDRHEDSFKIDLVLAPRQGLTVPVSMTVHALLRARLVLVEGPPAL